jgi:hypothetical protein
MDLIVQMATEVVTFLEIVFVVISFVKFVGGGNVANSCIQMKKSRIQVGKHLHQQPKFISVSPNKFNLFEMFQEDRH